MITSLNSKIYKIEAFLNNSFNKTIRELINYVLSGSDIISISYTSGIDPDSTTISEVSYNNVYNFKPPKYIYVTFNLCSEYGWTNQGGHSFCKCLLKDKRLNGGIGKILINWSTSSSDGFWTETRKTEELDIRFFRKIKLKQIEHGFLNL